MANSGKKGKVMGSETRKEKKPWEKPELTVLVRSRPEEAVLTGCKTSGGGGPQALLGKCGYVDGNCDVCSAIVSS